MRDLFWLSDETWAVLEPHLPKNQPGKPRVNDRRVISGILHILNEVALDPRLTMIHQVRSHIRSW